MTEGWIALSLPVRPEFIGSGGVPQVSSPGDVRERRLPREPAGDLGALFIRFPAGDGRRPENDGVGGKIGQEGRPDPFLHG